MYDNPVSLFPNSTCCIWGDSAFPCTTFLKLTIKTAFSNTLEERRFNSKLTKTRTVIENSFGNLKNTSQMLIICKCNFRKSGSNNINLLCFAQFSYRKWGKTCNVSINRPPTIRLQMKLLMIGSVLFRRQKNGMNKLIFWVVINKFQSNQQGYQSFPRDLQKSPTVNKLLN